MNVLVDSDGLFALFVPTDANHETSKKILSKLKDKNADLVVLNLVLQETATVLSHKLGQALALKFLRLKDNLDLTVLPLDEQVEKQAWALFNKQTKKGTSFIDCANLVVMSTYALDGIFSFDEFYPFQLRFMT